MEPRSRRKFARRLLFTAFASAAVVSVGGYLRFFEYIPPVDFVGLPDGRAKLIDGIDSCASVDALVRQLQSRAIHYALETYSAPRKEGRPPFDITTLTVQGFPHLGEQGTLVVEFFNDRLTATRFFPVDAERYRGRLLSEEGLYFDETRSEVMPAQHTRVSIGVDHMGREYVEWEDRRLAKQVSVWIKRYS